MEGSEVIQRSAGFLGEGKQETGAEQNAMQETDGRKAMRGPPW